MKGSLHTDALMHAVLDTDTGLRTTRRVSHVFVIDAPAYPRPLIVTDAAINIYPTLDDKVDIARNAIELAHALGIVRPNVAILSAVETVNSKITSTLDAAALCKMADRRQITGAVLDGPLAFDTAVSAAGRRNQGAALARRGRGRRPPRAGPGVRQHAGQAARVPRRGRDGGRGPRRAGAHRADEPVGLGAGAARVVRRRGPAGSGGVGPGPSGEPSARCGVCTDDGVRILVVEDEDVVARALCKLLAPYGDVVLAGTAREAERLLTTGPWDVLLIDLGLPDGSGMDVLAWARVNYPYTPAMILTGSVDPGQINRAFDLDADYVMKPIERARLPHFFARKT